MRVLVLGGTAEARELAVRLTGRGHEVVTSLAGRTRAAAGVAGSVRTGGFGGAAGLERYLREARIDRVVDATHPFAAAISRHAIEASAAAGVGLVTLRRPGWRAGPGDAWTWVADLPVAAGAARALPAGAVVLLTVGRGGAAAFADVPHRVVLRSVDPPTDAPAGWVVVLGRGPFTLDGERRLLQQHGVTVLVTRDSGGPTSAKLTAARELGVPVIMIARPVPADDDAVTDVEAAIVRVCG